MTRATGRAFWDLFFKHRYGLCPCCGEAIPAAGEDTVRLDKKCEHCGEWVVVWLYPGVVEDKTRWVEWGLGEPSLEAWETFYRRVGEVPGGCDHAEIKRYGKAYLCGRCGHAF